MPEELNVRAVYDYRFGTVQLNVDGIIRLKVVDLIKALNLPPDELAALLEDRYQWTEGNADIEPARLRMLAETDCSGKTCLDVGGFDGWAAAHCLRQGAARAICLDSEQWRHYGWEDKKLPGVEYVTGDLTTWTEPADIVIAYNIIYHTHHFWRMLSHLRKLTKPDGVMLYCGLQRYHRGPWIYVYEPREANPTDETVYFGPSIEATERLLKLTGWTFTQEGLAYDRVCYRCKPDPNFVDNHPEPGD